MRFEFNDIGELHQFMEWAGYTKRTDMLVQVAETVNTIAEAAVEVAEIAATVARDDEKTEPAAETAEAPKRKRRTKAEMEAARAAESGETSAANAAAGRPDTSATTSAGDAESASTPGAANPFAMPATQEEQRQAEPKSPPAAPVNPLESGDLAEFLAARMAERPELTAVEHLNLARTFIGKHGMPRYNESFPMAGLSANVMAFSPADCAKHAAVLDYLGSE